MPGDEVSLSRSDLETMLWTPIESTIEILIKTMESARVGPKELSKVLLVGGSARIPLVTQMITAHLGCSPVMDPDPEHVVALGAAALAGT